ncbi:MAG: hypothetical protein ACOYOM_14520, partial [Chloroflexota bacterium]
MGSTLQNLASLKGRRAWVLGTALAGAIAIALTSGVNPTRADNTPVSTPVAVASPEATVVAPVIPTPAATASAVATPVATLAVTTPRIRTNSVVRGRGTGPSPCIQASAVAWQDGQGWSGGDPNSTDCPASLGLKLTNESVTTATSTFRVGDIVRVEIAARANAATGTYGYAAYLDFDTADYQLVASDGRTPITNGATSGVVTVPGTIDGKSVTTRTNAYRTNTTGNPGGAAIGEIDLDVGVTLADAQTPPSVSPITIGPDADTRLGTFRLRVVRNETTPTTATSPVFRIGLRHSSAGGDRNSVITGAGDNVGLNILGKWDSVIPNIAQTTVSLVIANRTPGVVRIGDVLPIDIKLRANTDARHINTVQGKVSVATSSFIVVTGPGSTTPVAAGGRPISLNDSQLAAGGAATGTFVLVPADAGTAVVEINVTGPAALNLTAGQEKVIGTFYVRPVKKNVASITLSLDPGSAIEPVAAADKVGERGPNGSVGFAAMVTQDPTSGVAVGLLGISPASPCSTECSSLSIGAVRGTIGVSLEVRSPRANEPLLTSNNGWRAATSTMTPFTAVDGRYLDVKVIVNAGATDNR